MPGCADCIEELQDNGYDYRQAVFMAQYPPGLVTAVGHSWLCFRHKANPYIRKRPQTEPKIGPVGPTEGIAE